MKNPITLMAVFLLMVGSFFVAPSAEARFLQVDPIGYEDQMNLYAYVHNDPLNSRDPSGRCSEFTCPVNPFFGTPETNAATRAAESWAANQIAEGIIGGAPGMGVKDGVEAFQNNQPFIGILMVASEIPLAKPLKFLNPRLLKATQAKNALTGSQVKKMTKDMKANGPDSFPAIQVERAPDGTQYIVDGHHRAEAARRAGVDVKADVKDVDAAQAQKRADENFQAKCEDAGRC